MSKHYRQVTTRQDELREEYQLRKAMPKKPISVRAEEKKLDKQTQESIPLWT